MSITIRPGVRLHVAQVAGFFSSARVATHDGGSWEFSALSWRRTGATELPGGTPALLGSAEIQHDAANRYWLTIAAVTVAPAGTRRGLDPHSLLADLLTMLGLSRRDLPNPSIVTARPPDPFRRRPSTVVLPDYAAVTLPAPADDFGLADSPLMLEALQAIAAGRA